jgi:drug/metabolite transporter (DMT)-like permease
MTGALVWGLIWYPYRIFLDMGVSGELSTLLTYTIALIMGLMVTGPIWREMSTAGWWGVAIMLTSGWTNFGYVLAILDGEVMRVLLLFYLAPLWTIIFSRWILKEKLNRYGYLIIALSLAGAFTMLWHPQQGLPLPQNFSEWIAVSAGMGFAMLNVLVRRTQHLSVKFKSAAVWFGTVLLTVISFLYHGNLWEQVRSVPANGWWLMVLVGLVLCAISIIVQYGLTHLPANQAIVLFLSELVVAAVSSYFLAGEALGAREMIGAILIVSASLLSGKIHPEQEPSIVVKEITV